MYTLHKHRLKEILTRQNYDSVKDFCQKMQYSYHTLNSYLRGKSILQEQFQNLCHCLDISPLELIQYEPNPFQWKNTVIAPLIMKLEADLHDKCLVLFGSRTKKRPKQKKKDWDIGLYSKNGISGKKMLAFLRSIDDLREDLPEDVDFVNLTLADRDFFRSLDDNVMYLAGRRVHFRDLLFQIEQNMK